MDYSGITKQSYVRCTLTTVVVQLWASIWVLIVIKRFCISCCEATTFWAPRHLEIYNWFFHNKPCWVQVLHIGFGSPGILGIILGSSSPQWVFHNWIKLHTFTLHRHQIIGGDHQSEKVDAPSFDVREREKKTQQSTQSLANNTPPFPDS